MCVYIYIQKGKRTKTFLQSKFESSAIHLTINPRNFAWFFFIGDLRKDIIIDMF